MTGSAHEGADFFAEDDTSVSDSVGLSIPFPAVVGDKKIETEMSKAKLGPHFAADEG